MASITKSTGITSTGRNATTVEEVELVEAYDPDMERLRGMAGNLHEVPNGDQCRKTPIGQVASFDHHSGEKSRYGRTTV